MLRAFYYSIDRRTRRGRWCLQFTMTRQEIRELASIFQRQHGLAALRLAELRRDQHTPGSDAFELWAAIVNELEPVDVKTLTGQ